MKLLADKMLLATKPFDHPLAERARIALKRPAANHAPTAGCCDAICDRFVFGPEAVREISRIVPDPASRKAALASARLPMLPCWIETPDLAWFFDRLPDGRVEGLVFMAGRHVLFPIAVLFPEEWKAADVIHVAMLPLGAEMVSESGLSPDEFSRAAQFVIWLFAALTSPHVASTRLVVRSDAREPAARALARRQAQRGLRIDSFNVVSLMLPKAAHHAGVLKTVESFAGVRAHMVMGHWRLIDGVLHPYWRWIDGHPRGNAELGSVTKGRLVTFRSTRRGYALPSRDGTTGERLPAVPA